jgi:hypothetical protein
MQPVENRSQATANRYHHGEFRGRKVPTDAEEPTGIVAP